MGDETDALSLLRVLFAYLGTALAALLRACMLVGFGSFPRSRLAPQRFTQEKEKESRFFSSSPDGAYQFFVLLLWIEGQR